MIRKNSIWMECALALSMMLAPAGCSSGEDGTDGTDGANGTDGTNGTAGTDGTNGIDGLNGGGTLVFEGVGFPTTDTEKRAVVSSPTAWVNGTEVDLGDYHVLARTSDTVGSGTFGALVDEAGSPILDEFGDPVISAAPDYTSLLPVGDRIFSFTHLEDVPGGVMFSEVSQDAATGELSLISTAPVDLSSVGGIWIPCAGSVTPWKTHMGSEEYPPDASTYEGVADITEFAALNYGDTGVFTRDYFGIDITDNANLAAAQGAFLPYRYGFPVELGVDVDMGGVATPMVTKHYAMARVALELAYVMPDERTVFMTDDGTSVGLFMSIADAPRDLSAGHLYAARWTQYGAAGGGDAAIDWVALGHTDEATVDAAITGGVQFSDIFDRQPPLNDPDDGACPGGYTSVHTEAGHECLDLVMADVGLASRLETRRVAAYFGATTEFRKEEGLTFDPTRGTVYVSMSEVAKGMNDGSSNDLGGPNHIRLPSNSCGTVYELPVAATLLSATPGEVFGSDVFSAYVPYRMTGLVAGVPDGSVANNSCNIDGIANPDNVTVIPGYDVLIIGEDTGSGHQNDAIWAYDLYTHELTRIFTTPYGSETTSPYFHPNLGGFGYITAVVQHPYGESDQGMLTSPDEANAYVGYIGAFPRMD